MGEMEVAHAWGLRPSALGICNPDEDINYMATYTIAKSRMRAYEDYLYKKEVDRIRNK